MKYDIKYIGHNNKKTSVFSVNGVELCVYTRSERELEQHLNIFENKLNNNLRFEKYEDILGDTFKVIEYFSSDTPEIVKNYFECIKREMEELNPKKEPTKLQFFKYLTNTAENNNLRNKSFYNILIRRPNSLRILNEVFCESIKRHTPNFLLDNMIGLQNDTSIGKLTYLGFDDYMHKWQIDTFEIRIGNYMSNPNINELSGKICKLIDYIHEVVSSRMKVELIDFTDTIEIQILHLYYMVCNEELTSYLISRIKEVTKDRVRVGLCKFGAVRFMYTLCKNKNDYACNEKKLIERINHTARANHSKTIKDLFQSVIDNESVEQIDYLINSNDFDLKSDNWKYFYLKGNSLESKIFDFSLLRNSLIKRELKLYYKSLLADDMITKNTLRRDKELLSSLGCYSYVLVSINYLIESYEVFQSSDLTIDILDSFLKEVLATRLKGSFKGDNNTSLVESVFYSIKAFYNWVVENADRFKISKPNPYLFINFELNCSKIKAQSKPTAIIPEVVLEQLSEKMHHLKPIIYRRMLLIYLNCPRRFNEIQKAPIGCIKPKEINGIIQKDKNGNPIFELTYVEHKKMKNKDIVNRGLNYEEYTKHITVNYIVAREIFEQQEEIEELQKQLNKKRNANELVKIDKLFVVSDSKTKSGYRYVRENNFVRSINSFIKEQNIRDNSGNIWMFSARQTRKTSAYILIKNGANFHRIKSDLGHEKFKTTQEFYMEINKILLADTNTEFLKKEFDSRLFDEQKNRFTKYELELMFKQFCLESRIIYYCRKMLGVCTLNFEQKCPHQPNCNESVDDFPCANCPLLLTSASCKDAWTCLKDDQEVNLNIYIDFMKANNLEESELGTIPQYNIAKMKYQKALKIIEDIDDYIKMEDCNV